MTGRGPLRGRRRLLALATLAVAGAAVGVLALGLLRGHGAGAQVRNPEEVLAHFKCYHVAGGTNPNTDAILTDQFGRRQVVVEQPETFCNPTSKEIPPGSGIVTPIPPGLEAAHLKCYLVRRVSQAIDPAEGQVVEVHNQFTAGQLRVGIPVRLCVPTTKTSVAGLPEPPPPAPPERVLAHFTCYLAAGEGTAGQTIALKDQFGTENVLLGQPLYLCTPTVKEIPPRISPIPGGLEEAHLVCYETILIEPPAFFGLGITTNNQFGDESLEMVIPETLCVPSTKRVVPPELSHFKCYSAKAGFEPTTVTLTDQFETETPALIKRPELLCTPTKKQVDGTVTPITNPSAHLKCYELEEKSDFKGAAVEITNQFGTQRLKAKKALSLCAPSSKSVTDQPPGPAPTNLSHFKCYDVSGGESASRTVVLSDQFGEERGFVGKPVRLCNPVTKEHAGAIFPMVLPPSDLRHLVCYDLKATGFAARTVLVQNQFGLEKVDVDGPRLLCVPSTKRVL